MDLTQSLIREFLNGGVNPKEGNQPIIQPKFPETGPKKGHTSKILLCRFATFTRVFTSIGNISKFKGPFTIAISWTFATVIAWMIAILFYGVNKEQQSHKWVLNPFLYYFYTTLQPKDNNCSHNLNSDSSTNRGCKYPMIPISARLITIPIHSI